MVGGIGRASGALLLAAALACGGAGERGVQQLWTLEHSDSLGSGFLRLTAPPDREGVARLEWLRLRAWSDVTPKGARRRYAIWRQERMVDCDLQAAWDTARAVKLDEKGRDKGRADPGADVGNSRFLSTADPAGLLALRMACGYGEARNLTQAPTFATTAAALDYAVRALPEANVPPILAPPREMRGDPTQWPGDFYLVKGGAGQGLFLERGAGVRDGDWMTVRSLAVLPDRDGPGYTAVVRDVAFNCATTEETVGQAWFFTRPGQGMAVSTANYTRPVHGLPGTAAALALACGASFWGDRAKRIPGGVAGALAYARNGGLE